MTKTEKTILIICAGAAAVTACWWISRKRKKAAPKSPESFAEAGVATYGVPTPFGWMDIPFAMPNEDGTVTFLE